MDYQITQKFTCERASCYSLRDSATTQRLIASIVDPIKAALSSDQLLVLLSTNMVSSGSFSANVGACLAVWGTIGVEGLAVNPAGGGDTGEGGAPLIYFTPIGKTTRALACRMEISRCTWK